LLEPKQVERAAGAYRTKAPKKEITKIKLVPKEKETRATFIVNEDLLEKMKSLVY
jgi:hypothetical protein